MRRSDSMAAIEVYPPSYLCAEWHVDGREQRRRIQAPTRRRLLVLTGHFRSHSHSSSFARATDARWHWKHALPDLSGTSPQKNRVVPSRVQMSLQIVLSC